MSQNDFIIWLKGALLSCSDEEFSNKVWNQLSNVQQPVSFMKSFDYQMLNEHDHDGYGMGV